MSSCKKTLLIEIPSEDVNAEIEKAYDEVRTTALVPGFRKGKAPRSVLRMRFGEYVKGEVIEKLIPPAFEKAVEDAKLEILRPLDQADMKPSINELSVKENEPLTFEVTVDVKPEIILPDLTQLEVRKGDINVTKEDVDNLLHQLREERASFVPVEDRSAQPGDYVTLSILATWEKSPIPLDEVLEDQKEQVLEIGENMPIPELAEHLAGMSPDDEKEVSISFPADHQAENLAGKEVSFSISLHKIMEKHLPPLDDDFAKDLGEDDLQRLTADVWNQLVGIRRQEHRWKQESQLLSQLLEKSQFEVPEFLVEEQAKALMRSDKQRKQDARMGEIPHSPGSEAGEDELSQYRPSAIDEIRKAWIFGEIAKREQMNVSDEEIEARVRQLATAQNKDPQKYMRLLEAANRIDGIRAVIWESKIFDLLIEKASPEHTLIV